jgi:hypothetical protein
VPAGCLSRAVPGAATAAPTGGRLPRLKSMRNRARQPFPWVPLTAACSGAEQRARTTTSGIVAAAQNGTYACARVLQACSALGGLGHAVLGDQGHPSAIGPWRPTAHGEDYLCTVVDFAPRRRRRRDECSLGDHLRLRTVDSKCQSYRPQGLLSLLEREVPHPWHVAVSIHHPHIVSHEIDCPADPAIWDNDHMTSESVGGEQSGPICMNCHRPLRGNLRSERLDAQEATEGPQSRVGFIYCGACGWPIHVHLRSPFMAAGAPGGTKVATPSDETSLEGQFQLRCRDLISEIRALGFDPFVWVGLINDLGAAGAAKRALRK